MDDELLAILKDYVEGRMPHADWREWWDTHSKAVEARCDRYTFLRLKKEGFGGAVAILEQHGIAFEAVEGFCHQCGTPLFTAMPGETTPQQIRAFAESSRIRGWEQIIRDGWIHPGQYCPKGCTVIMWNIR